MNRFEMKSLDQWLTAPLEVDIPIEGEAGVVRRFECSLMADHFVGVYFHQDGEVWPVALGQGYMDISFTQTGAGFLRISGSEGAIARIRFRDQSQVVPAPDEASYTTIEPQETGENFEIRRAMHIMRLNQQRMRQELIAEVQRMHSKEAGDMALANRTGKVEVVHDPSAEVVEAAAPAPAPAKAAGAEAAPNE